MQMELVVCCTCSAPFAATIDFIKRRREDGKDFYCPSGHVQGFRENAAEKYDRVKAELTKTLNEKAKVDKALADEKTCSRKALEQVRELQAELAAARKPVAAGDLNARIKEMLAAGKEPWDIAQELGIHVNRVNGVKGGGRKAKVKLPSTNPVAAAKAVVDGIIEKTGG